MPASRTALGALAASAAFLAISAHAAPDNSTDRYAVMRDGVQIGTNSVRFSHDGPETTVETVTHVKVGFAFLTLYRFDQTETEQWTGGRLVAMASSTDDNGTIHRTSAAAHDGALLVQCDGKTSTDAPTAVPLSLWNSALVRQKSALDTRSGALEQVKVIDRGEDAVAVRGSTRRAHHYEIVTDFPQDVWYDDSGQLVQVEFKGTDGSTITYQLT
ncbi:MAG TPA: DUF6134 family protein [Rhizomicrobium sp.]|jgi:hypothetical protein|nr:DUF6134 family protein [Rhizomicrobium sp.]